MLVVFLNRSVRVDVCLLDSGARGRKSIADRGTEIDIESATLIIIIAQLRKKWMDIAKWILDKRTPGYSDCLGGGY